MGRVTDSVGIRVYDFEECSHFQPNPPPALQALQEHGSAGPQMCEQPIAVRFNQPPSCFNQNVSLFIYSRVKAPV